MVLTSGESQAQKLKESSLNLKTSGKATITPCRHICENTVLKNLYLIYYYRLGKFIGKKKNNTI